MTIALFDFDGTLTTKDSFFDFIKFSKTKPVFYFGILVLLPKLIGFKLGFWSAKKTKEDVLRYFFKDMPQATFENLGILYCKKRVPQILNPKAISALEQHKKNNDEIVVVTASIQQWVKPWCVSQKINCIATQVEVKDNALTGHINGNNCNGIEKINQINALYTLETYTHIYAYGNSKGDKPMLNMATHPFYKVF